MLLYNGPHAKSEKVGWWCWVSSRMGWLLELLTELTISKPSWAQKRKARRWETPKFTHPPKLYLCWCWRQKKVNSTFLCAEAKVICECVGVISKRKKLLALVLLLCLQKKVKSHHDILRDKKDKIRTYCSGKVCRIEKKEHWELHWCMNAKIQPLHSRANQSRHTSSTFISFLQWCYKNTEISITVIEMDHQCNTKLRLKRMQDFPRL